MHIQRMRGLVVVAQCLQPKALASIHRGSYCTRSQQWLVLFMCFAFTLVLCFVSTYPVRLIIELLWQTICCNLIWFTYVRVSEHETSFNPTMRIISVGLETRPAFLLSQLHTQALFYKLLHVCYWSAWRCRDYWRLLETSRDWRPVQTTIHQ